MTIKPRNLGISALILAAGLLPAVPSAPPALAQAQQPQQPSDWPCVQRLVPRLEPGQMWSGPPLDAAAAPDTIDPDIQKLAGELVDPERPAEALEQRVASFARGLPTEQRAAGLTALFGSAFAQANEARARQIRGIENYARSQKGLAARIAEETRRLETLKPQATAETAQLQELQAARDWDTRIFADRQHSLRLVCEQPVLLEQRLFALARVIQDHLP